ncbi:hypothetical protein QTP88_006828 [Uroleucon formosanum]
MSDRIILSVTTVQKTQNRKTSAAAAAAALSLLPTIRYQLPLANSARPVVVVRRERSRGEEEGGGFPLSRRQPPLRRQNDAVQTPTEHGYSLSRPNTVSRSTI